MAASRRERRAAGISGFRDDGSGGRPIDVVDHLGTGAGFAR
jgi:hypothetical protein